MIDMIYSYVFIFSNPCSEADPQIIIKDHIYVVYEYVHVNTDI